MNSPLFMYDFGVSIPVCNYKHHLCKAGAMAVA